jgi:hypothetical protein
MGREYSVDDIDMIYQGSTGNNDGEGENAEYIFRTPATVTPSSSISITKKKFNNHRIIQTNQDVKALNYAQGVFMLDQDLNNINKEAYEETGWRPNRGILTKSKEKQLEDIINALEIAKLNMGSPDKKKAGKRKSLKKKRKTKKRKRRFKSSRV